MGKGSGRRPTFISEEQFAANMAMWQTPKPKRVPYVSPPLKCDCDWGVPMQNETGRYCAKCKGALPE